MTFSADAFGVAVNALTCGEYALDLLLGGTKMYQRSYSLDTFARTMEEWLSSAEKALDSLTPEDLVCIEQYRKEHSGIQSIDQLRSMYGEHRRLYNTFKCVYATSSFRERWSPRSKLRISVDRLHNHILRLVWDIHNTTSKALQESLDDLGEYPVADDAATLQGYDNANPDHIELDVLRALGLQTATQAEAEEPPAFRSMMEW